MNRYLLIALGAALGANARDLIGVWAGGRIGAGFPFGTMVVNVTGSLILGFFLTLSTELLITSPQVRLFLATGFLGSYTTFSTYMVESLHLIMEGNYLLGIVDIVASVLLGLAAALVGVFLARLVPDLTCVYTLRFDCGMIG